MKKLPHQNTVAVFYPCTFKEYENGDLQSSLDKLFKSSSLNSHSFDLYFIFNFTLDHDFPDLHTLCDNKFVNNFYIHDLNLDIEDDLYIQNWGESKSFLPDVIPPHGLSSGPNNSFYQSLYYLLDLPSDYKYFFLLETDIQVLKNDWLNILLNFCKENNFLIAGSKYKGIQKWHRVLDYKDHLNGIALYENSENLLSLLKNSETHLINKVSSGVFFINFDIAIDEWRRTPEGKSFFLQSYPLLDTDFITNASDPEDCKVSKDKILKHYPKTVFLHHKTDSSNLSFNTSEASIDMDSINDILDIGFKFFTPDSSKINIPLFYHIPKNAGTFTQAFTQVLLRKYNRDNFLSWPKELRLTLDGKELFSVFIIDEEVIPDNPKYNHIDSITYSIDINKLEKDFFDQFPVFSITIHSTGFRKLKLLLDLFDLDIYCFQPYTFLREPLDRSLSMYQYNNSEISSHDLNHGLINYESFVEYIDSIRFEDAWLIRSILDLPDSVEVNEEIYDKFISLFELFKVFDLNNCDIEKSITSIYDKIFDLDPDSIPNEWMSDLPSFRNQNKSKTLSKEFLNPKDLLQFEAKSFYDYKIYNKYR